jgi:hypothetical protein
MVCPTSFTSLHGNGIYQDAGRRTQSKSKSTPRSMQESMHSMKRSSKMWNSDHSDQGREKVVRRQDPVSCQFCRKKKLKCDRGNPCSNCRARALTCSSALGE